MQSYEKCDHTLSCYTTTRPTTTRNATISAPTTTTDCCCCSYYYCYYKFSLKVTVLDLKLLFFYLPCACRFPCFDNPLFKFASSKVVSYNAECCCFHLTTSSLLSSAVHTAPKAYTMTSHGHSSDEIQMLQV